MRIDDLSLDTLKEAVKTTKNKSACERVALGTRQKKYADALVNRIDEEGIDRSHWTGRYHSLPTAIKKRKDITLVSRSMLRKKVLTENLIEEKCSICGSNPIWRGLPMSLHLDHIDGNSRNSHLSNLRFLCPNCHQQTSTWGGANGKRKLPKDDKVLLELASKGVLYKDIAAQFGVHVSSISHRLRKYNA